MKNLRLQHGFVFSEEDASKEDADKMWRRAMEIYEEHHEEIDDVSEFENGGGVLLDDALKHFGMSR